MALPLRLAPLVALLLAACPGSQPPGGQPGRDLGFGDRLRLADSGPWPEAGAPRDSAARDGAPAADGPAAADARPVDAQPADAPVPDTQPPVPSFGDVPPTHPHRTAIEWVAQRGYMRGCQETPPAFCPDVGLTRAQAAVTIVRMKYGATFSASSTPHFSDVPATHWAFREIQRIFEDGITSGCAAGKFCPEDALTRAQGATFLARAKHGTTFSYSKAPHFADVPATHPHFAGIQRLFEDGIAQGCGGGNYCPADALLRGQWASFLMRAQTL